MLSPAHLGLYALFVAHTSDARFTLAHPAAFGTHSTTQAKDPCGDTQLLLERTTEYYVGGDAVATVTTENGVNILIRGTLDLLAASNWTNLFPIVAQSNSGRFCEPLVPAPLDWAGKDGIIQVIQSGESGLSYQCAPVSFRGTRATSVTTLCSNGSDVTGEFSSDPKLPSDGVGLEVTTLLSLTAGGDPTSTSEPPAATTSQSTGRSLAAQTMMIGVLGACLMTAALLS